MKAASRVPNRAFERLERHMAKVIRVVLRGGGDSNAASLPDMNHWMSNLLTEGLQRTANKFAASSSSSVSLRQMPVGFETSDPLVYVAITSLLSLVLAPAALRRTPVEVGFRGTETEASRRGAQASDRAVDRRSRPVKYFSRFCISYWGTIREHSRMEARKPGVSPTETNPSFRLFAT